MRVSTIYLKSGEATTVSEGLCQTFADRQKLTGLMCAAKVDEAGRRTTAIVTFDVAVGHSAPLVDRSQSGSPDRTEGVADKNRDLSPDGSTFKTLPNGTKVTTLPNGNKFEELSDGTTWVVLPQDGDFLGVRVDPNVMSTALSFHTEMIRNLPRSDILNAPRSARIQVEGDCSSMTYSLLGTLPYAGENGGGLPDVQAATGPENVVRKVLPDSPMARVFDVVCKKR